MTSNDFRISDAQALLAAVSASNNRANCAGQRGVARPLHAFVNNALILGKSALRQVENRLEATRNCTCTNDFVVA